MFLMFFLLQSDSVEYASKHICAFEGSTVEISCTYTYPPRISYKKTVVQREFWYAKLKDKNPLDLREDPDYAGRVTYRCSEQNCSLRISGLRLNDFAQYKFRFETNQPDGSFTGKPGVSLTVTGPRVQVIRSGLELVCHSSCFPRHHLSFVWFMNGQEVQGETSDYYRKPVSPEASYSCSYQGHRSPEVYAPKSVSVSMSLTEIMEGSSVTLTCSCDANPAAKFRWYKNNQTLLRKDPSLILRSIQRSDSRKYHCVAENELGEAASDHVFINVEYPPETSSVSVSPSAEVLEGSSVTLTCSSDANPAANYTWYKKDEDSPKTSGPIWTISDFRCKCSLAFTLHGSSDPIPIFFLSCGTDRI
uniref:Ig-like domain-containing protein n=1 Tax=Oryzias latipes TaxID=8090 RepID=A0A3B3HXG8_ORYLA